MSVSNVCPPIPLLDRHAVAPLRRPLGCSPSPKRTVARLLTGGKLRACRVGGRVLMDVASLKVFLADQPANTAANATVFGALHPCEAEGKTIIREAAGAGRPLSTRFCVNPSRIS